MSSGTESGFSSIDPGVSALAAWVGHELNNIGVPLDGFAEMALQDLDAASPARQYLQEMLIGIARVRALAHQLESLGECESNPARVTISACMPDADDGNSVESWTIHWACDAGTVVTVDQLHAKRAIRALLATAWKASPHALFLPVLTVSQNPAHDATCVTCGSVLSHNGADIRVEPDNPRPVAEGAVRDPFGREGVGRTGQRLAMAILVHCAHRAGGHLLLDRRSGALSLAFPAA